VSVWFYQSSAAADLVCLIMMSTAAAGRSRTSFVSNCCQSTGEVTDCVSESVPKQTLALGHTYDKLRTTWI